MSFIDNKKKKKKSRKREYSVDRDTEIKEHTSKSKKKKYRQNTVGDLLSTAKLTCSTESEINKDILSIAQSITRKCFSPGSASELSDLDICMSPVKKINRGSVLRRVQLLETAQTLTVSSNKMPKNNLDHKTKVLAGGRQQSLPIHALSDSEESGDSDSDTTLDKSNLKQQTSVKKSVKQVVVKPVSDSDESNSSEDESTIKTKVSGSRTSRQTMGGSGDTLDVDFVSPVSFECPEGMTPLAFNNSNTACWLEDALGDQKELWIIKVPDNFDTTRLNGLKMPARGTVVVPPAEERNGIFYEARTSNTNQELSSLKVILPSKRHSKLCVAPSVMRQMEIVQSLRTEEVVSPSPPRPKNMALPSGLKYRNVPFGGDSPERIDFPPSPERTSHKRKHSRGASAKKESSKKKKMSIDETAKPITGKDVNISNGSARSSEKPKKKQHGYAAVGMKVDIKQEIDHFYPVNDAAIKTEKVDCVDMPSPIKKSKKKKKKDSLIEPIDAVVKTESVEFDAQMDHSLTKKEKKKKKKQDQEDKKVKQEVMSQDMLDGNASETILTGSITDGGQKMKKKKHKKHKHSN